MAAISTAHVKVIPEIDPADLDAAMVEAIAVRVAEILAARPLALTKVLTIDTDSGVVTLDGRNLGAFIARENIKITL